MRIAFLLLIAPLVCGDRIVVTNNGPIKGTSIKGKKVEAYLGIPYAEPPVGSLRFAKPVPKSSWEEIYYADELPPSCIQVDFPETDLIIDRSKNMSEDCLFLNIWVPRRGRCCKPIMLYIHGGGFMYGSSNMKIFDGAPLSEYGDVIVVTINYRVGTLGFFTGFIDEADGNMGMYDQVMAIQWIKDNARHFGGDPENIVLFGESSGGTSVSLHSISPLSRNLFKRFILESGTAFHMASVDNNILYRGSQTIATLSGCADNTTTLKQNPKDVVDCMKNLPAERFSEVDSNFLQSGGNLFPRVGDDFLPNDPIDSFRRGDFKKSEVLLGVNRDEGALFLVLQFLGIFGAWGRGGIDVSKINETLAKEVIRTMTNMSDDSEIVRSYLDRVGDESGYTYINAMKDIVGDFIITCGVVFEADFQSLKNNPAYFYVFDYRPPSSFYAEWMGVIHFDEVPYVFGKPMYNNFTEEEKEVSRNMMDMWLAFAETGNPNFSRKARWPRYTCKNPKYLSIGEDNLVAVRPDNYRCEVWRSFFRAELYDRASQNKWNSAY